MKHFFTLVALATALVLASGRLVAADDSAAELKRKQEEVERLKRDLDKAQSDVKRLQKENQRLRKEDAATPPAAAQPGHATAAAPAPAAALPPAKPIATLPPLGPDETVELAELIGHYRATPEAAAQRYQKKTIRIRGEVSRFDVKTFRRAYDVFLVSPDPAVRVVCEFSYADDNNTSSIYTAKRGSELVRSLTRGSTFPILAIGDQVTIRGKCVGFEHGEIVLSGCELRR